MRVLVVGVLVAGALILRPQALGGSLNYVVIHGNSMLPTYHDGYLVLTHEKASYQVGDIVAYRVPRGALGAGRLIVHRIIGGSPTSGFVMKGDHNSFADPWQPRVADVAGSSWIVGPRIGPLMVFVRQPLVAATIATLMAITLWWRPGRRERPGD